MMQTAQRDGWASSLDHSRSIHPALFLATLVSLNWGLITPVGLPAQQIPTEVRQPWFGIRVLDEATGRGIPLIQLKTVNDTRFVTDSAGWIAFDEPGLMNREVYFEVSGPGYEHAADGFGFRGVRLQPAAGTVVVVKVKRTNIAERVVRLTGGGIFRDSELLGVAVPKGIPALNAGVLGSDSVQAVPYGDGLFWLWGDTNLANYPLGNFHTTSATSPLPGTDTYHPADGVPFTYFTDPQQPNRVRKMLPLTEPGPVWLFGLLTVKDPTGKTALVSHYTRRKSLAEEAEHGLCRFDDATGQFQKLVQFELSNTWQIPNGNAVLVQDDDRPRFYFSGPFAQTRVAAEWSSLLDPRQYEALTVDPETKQYRWQRAQAPTSQDREAQLLRQNKLARTDARYQLQDADGKAITLHHSSIQYNDFRKRWIMIGLQIAKDNGPPSHLGEVWYAEAETISGPWRKAVKIASHPKYSFYNPRQHLYFAEDGGRVIYFEGTYTHTFSGNGIITPRYEYNQLLYRLNLADERLKFAQEN